MITLDFNQLFKTDLNFSKVPRIVFDWVLSKEKEYPNLEYQIRFSERNQAEEEKNGISYDRYERIYGPSLPDLRNVMFPLKKQIWFVRIIGDIRDARAASGLIELMNNNDPRIEIIPPQTPSRTLRGFIRENPIASSEGEMIKIKYDRNINDEWEFRGTPQEFMDEKVKPLLN